LSQTATNATMKGQFSCFKSRRPESQLGVSVIFLSPFSQMLKERLSELFEFITHTKTPLPKPRNSYHSITMWCAANSTVKDLGSFRIMHSYIYTYTHTYTHINKCTLSSPGLIKVKLSLRLA
jgi:hypothetical protein